MPTPNWIRPEKATEFYRTWRREEGGVITEVEEVTPTVWRVTQNTPVNGESGPRHHIGDLVKQPNGCFRAYTPSFPGWGEPLPKGTTSSDISYADPNAAVDWLIEAQQPPTPPTSPKNDRYAFIQHRTNELWNVARNGSPGGARTPPTLLLEVVRRLAEETGDQGTINLVAQLASAYWSAHESTRAGQGT